MKASITIPMVLPSMANLRHHWAARARKVKAQRAATLLALKTHRVQRPTAERMVVTLTRRAPRFLDTDNLQSAFKGVRDEIAAFIGIDDGCDRIAWVYQQTKGPAAVLIQLEALP